MKFYIDNTEIKTVIKGAEILGSFHLISREAIFSYIYNANDPLFQIYKVKLGSKVLIKNDNGENIFKGKVENINFSKDKSIVQIQAQDMLYSLVKTKIKGRFKGAFLFILNNLIKDFGIANSIKNFLSKEINILSLGKLSVYDILSVAAKKMYGDEVKIYLDGDSRIKFLVPKISSLRETLILGRNVLNASFKSKGDKNAAQITAIGNDKVVSGSLVLLYDELKGNSSYFVVQKDKHIFGNIYTMELELLERKI